MKSRISIFKLTVLRASGLVAAGVYSFIKKQQQSHIQQSTTLTWKWNRVLLWSGAASFQNVYFCAVWDWWMILLDPYVSYVSEAFSTTRTAPWIKELFYDLPIWAFLAQIYLSESEEGISFNVENKWTITLLENTRETFIVIHRIL